MKREWTSVWFDQSGDMRGVESRENLLEGDWAGIDRCAGVVVVLTVFCNNNNNNLYSFYSVLCKRC
jgi:hypothetical protein